MRVDVRSCQGSDESYRGFDACGFLELDESFFRQATKGGRLFPGRAKAARGDDVAVGVEVDLKRLHISPRRADGKVAVEARVCVCVGLQSLQLRH